MSLILIAINCSNNIKITYNEINGVLLMVNNDKSNDPIFCTMA